MAAGIAGFAGFAGFATFLMVHHLWIVPIWFIAPAGLLVAVAGGAAVGAAYAELLPNLPRRPWTALGVIVIISAILLPSFVIAQIRGPIFAMDGDGGGRLLVADSEAIAGVALGLIAATLVAGAGLAWLFVGTRRAVGTTALAALAFALGPGHNIPLLGGTPAVAKEIVILAAVVGVASVVLIEAHARFMRLGSSPSG